MNINVINDKDFHIKPFEQHLSKNNSLINILDNNQPLMNSLKSIGMFDSEVILETNDSNPFSLQEDLRENMTLTNHCTMKDFSFVSLSKGMFLQMESEVMNTRFCPRSSLLAMGLLNGTLAVADIQTHSLRYMIQTSTNKFSVSSIRWKVAEEDIITALGAEGTVSSFNLTNNKTRFKIAKKDTQLLSLEYELDGNHFLMGDNHGNILRVNEHTQKETDKFSSASFFNNGHSNRVFAIKCLHDNPFVFLSGGWDGMIFAWDVREQKPIKYLDGNKISGESLDYKNGKILVGSYDKKHPLTIFNFKTMTEETTIQPSFDNQSSDLAVYGSQFSPSKNSFSVFACSSNPNVVRVYEARKGDKKKYFHSWSVEGFEKGIYSIHLSPNNKYMSMGCGDKTVSVVNINNFEQIIITKFWNHSLSVFQSMGRYQILLYQKQILFLKCKKSILYQMFK